MGGAARSSAPKSTPATFGSVSATRYTYGDSEFAAERLDLVARVFEPTSRRFLERCGAHEPRLAVDLGCGPGNTTGLIAEVLHPLRTVGLDRSGPFLERARRDALPGVTFVEHDVLETPFPIGPADVVSCRLLLSHLPDRAAAVARWATQLAPGGLLLLDEIEEVRSDEPAFMTYLALAQEVVARAGGRLLVGADLAAMPDPPRTERVVDDVVTLDISPADAARIFGMNLAVLVERGEVDPRPDLAGDLTEIERSDEAAETVWRMRQLAFRRARS
jgi:SAM-dependent methyltransferase